VPGVPRHFELGRVPKPDVQGVCGEGQVTWLAQNLHPVVFGLAAWMAIAVGLCVLVSLGVSVTWLVWWSIRVRVRRKRL